MKRKLAFILAGCVLLGLTAVVSSQATTNAGGGVVVSGFEPFGGRSQNASWTLAQEIHKAFPSVQARQVPVVWGAPATALSAVNPAPEVWVAFGEGTRTFQIEVLAHNQRGGHRDNEKKLPSAPHIVQGGETLLRNQVDAAALATALTAAGFPTLASENAGSYLCEEMLYTLLHAQKHPPRPDAFRLVLFVHVPTLEQTVTIPPTKKDGPETVKTVNAEWLAAFGQQLIATIQKQHAVKL